MSAAVKPSTDGDVAAFAVSVALHGAFLLLPVVASWHGRTPAPKLDPLPNSVAMLGNSIEVEAPTAELAASPGVAPETTPIAGKPDRATPAPATRLDDGIDVKALPLEKPKVEPPRVRRLSKPSAASPAATPAAGAAPDSARTPAAGTFGQEGLPPGVRRLGYAFTRAIPAATPGDSAWRELAPGKVGTIRIELEVDENNHLGALKHWQARPGEPAPPPALERMVERTLLLLRAGQFALSSSNQAGSERLVIDVQLSDEPPDEDATNEVVQKKFEGASPGHPGKAYFRYGTGRTFEAKVTIVSSGRALP